MMKMKNQKGFTLIEILIVVIIIGILVLLALPQIGAFRQTAYMNTCASNCDTLRNLAEAFLTAGGGVAAITGAAPTLQGQLTAGNFEANTTFCPAQLALGAAAAVDTYDYNPTPGGVRTPLSTVWCTVAGARGAALPAAGNHWAQ